MVEVGRDRSPTTPSIHLAKEMLMNPRQSMARLAVVATAPAA
jgi:hypothetical protein